MRERIAVRVLLLDGQDRLLLVRGRLPKRADGPWFWFTVGGEIEPGESIQQAALREAAEETGLTDLVLGPVVWKQAFVLKGFADEPLMVRERFIVARTAGGEISRAGWTELERQMLADMRWWTLAELGTSGEIVYPEGLAGLLPAILAGDFPDPVLDIGPR